MNLHHGFNHHPVRVIVLAALGLAGLGALLPVVLKSLRRTATPAGLGAALATEIYVWQQQWSPAVARTLSEAQPATDRFLVYAANLRVDDTAIKIEYTQPDWRALAGCGRPVGAVIRADSRLARWLEDGRFAQAVAKLREAAARMRAQAGAAGCAVGAVQLDYDCPTARLASYTRLLKTLSQEAPPLALSITALPTWMASRQFGPLVRAAASFTLQVHGVERPTTIDKPIVLCDYAKIPAWVEKADAFGCPFTVALPTYGYRVLFDPQGRYQGLLAEERAPDERDAGQQERLVMADPAALAMVVERLRRNPPHHCRALTWFRLPVETDQLNWPWPTLRAVATGRAPRLTFKAELRPTGDPALAEVWLANTGEANLWREVRIPINRNKKNILASDLMMGFREEAVDTLAGMPPTIGNSFMIAWYRLAADAPTSSTLTLGEVQVRP